MLGLSKFVPANVHTITQEASQTTRTFFRVLEKALRDLESLLAQARV